MSTSLTIDWAPDRLPEGVHVEPHALRTHDGAAVTGLLYRCGNPSTAVCLMHPREYFGFHYLVPPLLRAGAAVWAQGSRSIGLDIRLEHEQAILDVAAGLATLRARGFTQIVLLGNSGGAGLFCFYNEQAERAPADRIAKTAGGRPVPLQEAVLPAVDGVVLLAPHPGQGRLLMGCIDPSVADEADPLSVDPALDPFSPANGYSAEPGASRYSPDFVQRYRQAQVERVHRLDDTASELIKRRMDARKRLKSGGEVHDSRVAAHTPIMTVWRTDADLRCLDLSLDPSDRKPGSVWGADMLASNYGAVGFGRTCTPESWLSSWSGVSSSAALERTAPSIRCPAAVVEYTGDQTTFPSTIVDIVTWIGSAGTQRMRIRGDHHGRPLAPGETAGRTLAGDAIADWLRRHDFI